ncbi:MAG: DUF1194 domain-containing protein [Pseudomonadota bacterium]
MRLITLFLLCLLAAPAQAACRHALVLALDISGSVNLTEYDQQQRGLAAALRSDEVIDLLLSDTRNPVHVVVFEWSSEKHQEIIQDWVAFEDASVITEVAGRIEENIKSRATFKTAIGSAMHFAFDLLRQKQDCDRMTIDISGDGKNNNGIPPENIRPSAGNARVVVNALVIGAETDAAPHRHIAATEALQRYYEGSVIRGPGSFSIVAKNFDHYADAMKQKLIRELSPIMLSDITKYKN